MDQALKLSAISHKIFNLADPLNSPGVAPIIDNTEKETRRTFKGAIFFRETYSKIDFRAFKRKTDSKSDLKSF